MNEKTRQLFSTTCEGVPQQRRGHIPSLQITGRNVVCTCSCGVKPYRANYGNTAGWSYAVAYANLWYREHISND